MYTSINYKINKMKINKKELRIRHRYIMDYVENRHEWLPHVEEHINQILNMPTPLVLTVAATCAKNFLFDRLIFAIYKEDQFLFYSFIPIYDSYKNSNTSCFERYIVKDCLENKINLKD